MAMPIIDGDRPPSRMELRDLANATIAQIGDLLVELGLAIGVHGASGDEVDAGYAAETLTRVSRELEAELKQFRQMVMIDSAV
jgi:hypothetical protein